MMCLNPLKFTVIFNKICVFLVLKNRDTEKHRKVFIDEDEKQYTRLVLLFEKLALSILQIQSGGNLAFDLKKILEHEMVPKHEVLSKKESEELLKKYGITSDNLPKINENDPVVQVVKAKKGDVLRIIRQSPTAGEAVYFRLVV